MNYLIKITPVTGNQRAVAKLLTRFLDSGNLEEAIELVKKGGVVLENLDREQAETIAGKLRELEVQVEVQPMGEDDPMGGQFHVKLVDAGEQVIQVIKEVREITGLSLKDSKNLVDQLGEIGRYEDQKEAHRIKKLLESRGAEVTVERTDIPEPEGPARPAQSDRYVVYGQILLENEEPAEGFKVKLYDRDLRNEQLLGEDQTDGKGNYLIEYQLDDFRKGDVRGPDLLIRIFSKLGDELPAEVTNRELTKVGDDSILFNAGPEEEISFRIQESGLQLSRFEELTRIIRPLLGEVKPEDFSAEDVYFLHHETGIEVHQIAFFSDDHRLSGQTGMPGGVFFGLAMLETGVVHDDENELPRIDLPALAGEPVETLMERAKRAIKTQLIPRQIESKLEEIQRYLGQIRSRNRDRNPKIRRERIAKVVRLTGIDENTQQTVADKLAEVRAEEDEKDPLDQLARDGVLNKEQAESVKTAFELDRLTGGNHLMADVLVKGNLPGIKKVESLRDLTSLQPNDWKQIIEDHEVDLTGGVTTDEYADRLARRIEERYPADVLNHRVVKRDFTKTFQSVENTITLLEHNERLFDRLTKGTLTPDNVNFKDLSADRVGELKNELDNLRRFGRTFSSLGIPEVLDDGSLEPEEKMEQIRERLADLSRFMESNNSIDLKTADFFGLSKNGHADLVFEGIREESQPLVRKQAMAFQRVMNLAPDIDTAHRLLANGFDTAGRIQAHVPDTISRQTGLDIETASTLYRRANAVALESKRLAQNFAVDHPDVRMEPFFMTASEQTDNELKKIDGYEDLFGPQNYCSCNHCISIFGPVAYFVDLMRFVEKHVLTPEFNGNAGHPLHLKARRPDLWETELSCNAATELVPTLMIVNEILERYVASGEEEGQRAEKAYERLESAKHSFNLPFHRPLAELRIYLQNLGLELDQVVELVNGWGTRAARETLHLSKKEARRIIETETSESALRPLYGYEQGEDLKELPVPRVLKVTGLSRSELTRLIQLPLIKNAFDLKIRRDRIPGTSNRFEEYLENLGTEALDRIHRFVRLSKALPWTLEALDYVIRRQAAALFDDDSSENEREKALERIATLYQVQQRLDLRVGTLLCIVDVVPAEPLEADGTSLFDRFFNPERMVPDPLEYWEVSESHEFTYDLSSETEEEPEELDENYYRLLEAVRLGEDDFVKLLRRVLAEEDEDDDDQFQLDHEILSKLIRYGELVRNLNLAPEVLFKALSFFEDAEAGGEDKDRLDGLLELLRFIEWQKNSSFSVEQLYDIIKETESEWADERILEILNEAHAAASEVDFSSELFADIPDISVDEIDVLLELLLEQDLVKVIETEDDSDSGQQRYRVTDQFDPDKELSLSFQDGESNSEHDTELNTLGEQEERLREKLSTRLPEEAGLTVLASAFDQTPSLLRELSVFTEFDRDGRTDWLKLVDSPPENGAVPDDIKSFFHDLERSLQWARPLNMNSDTLRFITGHPELFGMDEEKAPSLDTIRKLSAYVRLSGDVDNLQTLNNLLLSGVKNAELLAELTGTSVSYVNSFLEYMPLPATTEANGGDSEHAIDRFVKLRKCLETGKRIGINGRTLRNMVSSSYESLESAHKAVLAAFKAAYDDTRTFEKKLRSTRDKIREVRRDALVDYILTRPELSFDTPRDIYHYLLIDTQVAGCADTSRIVQATKSVQLYVHRCLMGLEAGTVDEDEEDSIRISPSSEMRMEWEWRKNYRVWEANRKVFVYPENYLDPDIRDNKSPEFKAVEDKLLQQDITAETVERAYKGYLEKLQDLAGLTVQSACYNEQEEAYYFIGRTSRQDSNFYLRKMSYIGDAAGWKSIIYDSSRPVEWESWEEIDLKINAPVVTPFFYRNRLYLFWIESRPEKKSSVKGGSVEDEGTEHTIILKIAFRTQDDAWSEVQEIELLKSKRQFPIELIEEKRFRIVEYKCYPFVSNKKLYVDYLEWHSSNSSREVLRFEIDQFSGTAKKLGRIASSNLEADIGVSEYFKVYDYHSSRDRYELISYREKYQSDLKVDYLDSLHNEPYWNTSALPDQYISLTDPSRRSFYFGSNEVLNESFIYTIHQAPGNVLVKIKDNIYFFEHHIDAFLLFPIPKWRVWPMTTGVIGELGSTLLRGGMDDLLDPETSENIAEAPFPLTVSETEVLKIQDSFQPGGPFELYYRELFLHLPLLIARQLNSVGNFEEAQKWYHYVFDPTTDEDPPTRQEIEDGVSPAAHYWKYPEFRNAPLHPDESLVENDEAIAQYRKNPFSPHAIARLRMRSYQKAIVMDYVDNLLDWADSLFARDSRESINEATMLYIMAADILGPRPEKLGECQTIEAPEGATSFEDLQIEGEFDISVENLVVAYQAQMETGAGTNGAGDANGNGSHLQMKSLQYDLNLEDSTIFAGGSLIHLGMAGEPIQRLENGKKIDLNLLKAAAASSAAPNTGEAFCLPANEQMIGYWERVEDRLFKIRNCMNIDGEKRTLALFEPPIDPMMMARAKAAGLSLQDALDLSAAELPAYRFQVLLERAKSYAATVQNFGGALLNALEKKDTEELRRLQSTHKRNILNLTTSMKERQIEIEQHSLDALKDSREAVEFRRDYYDGLIKNGLSVYEEAHLASMTLAQAFEMYGNQINTAASIVHAVPQVGAPTAMTYGGREIGAVLTALGGAFGNYASLARFSASMNSTLGNYDRRSEGWEFQRDSADKELKEIDKRILAAEIRISIAERQLEIHEKAKEQAEELFDFYEEKFSNLGLYTWLSSELNRMYRTAYNLAHEMALQAQRAYQYERDDNTVFIEPDHWDVQHAGLLAGEKLQLQLRHMEKAYLESGERDFELDQTFSLAQINPLALQELRENGSCQFNAAELFFDIAYPGQYNRRIKSVRLTIPCVTGPYVNVNAKLTLQQSYRRKKPTLDEEAIVREHRPRGTSIATSRAQNDGGVFELNFNDQRYLPFEGAGAISEWKLELPKAFRSFDYDSISDVLLHISYTAKEDGSYRQEVEENLEEIFNSLAEEVGIQRVISIGEEFSSQFRHLFMGLDNEEKEEQTLAIEVNYRHFPHYLKGKPLKIQKTGFVLVPDKNWSEILEDQSSNLDDIGLNVEYKSTGTEVEKDSKLEMNGQPDPFSDYPFGIVELDQDGIEIDRHGVSMKINVDREDLLSFCETLMQSNGSDTEATGNTAQKVADIIADIHLLLSIKL